MEFLDEFPGALGEQGFGFFDERHPDGLAAAMAAARGGRARGAVDAAAFGTTPDTADIEFGSKPRSFNDGSPVWGSVGGSVPGMNRYQAKHFPR